MIRDSHSGVTEDSSHLSYDAVLLVK